MMTSDNEDDWRATAMGISSAWKTAAVVGVVAVIGVTGYAWNESKARPDAPTGSTIVPGGTSPAPQSSPDPPRTTPVAEPETQCDNLDFPNHIPMSIGGITPVTDLVMCANEMQNEVTVENTSKSTVWLLKHEGIAYWPVKYDLNKSLTTQLFRQSVRTRYDNPYLTIEPDVTARLSGPGELAFYVNDELQALWQSSELLAELVRAAKDEYGDEVTGRAKEFVSGNSKYRKAALDCGESAFDIGGQISEAKQDPSDVVLEDVFGVYGQSTACLTSLEEANRAAKEESKIPLVQVNNIEDIGTRSGWSEGTDDVFRFLAKVGQEAVRR
jgi:hypothetical protein